MEVLDKLKILSDAAKYDVSCSSSGSARKNKKGGLGNASLTINFYKRNYIEGLFLSSAVYKSPSYTMELLLNTVRRLREEEHFNGYIHLKAIPGADKALIERAGMYVDRMSVKAVVFLIFRNNYKILIIIMQL